MNHPSAAPSRKFFPILGFALSRAVLCSIAITVLLLVLKGFTTYYTSLDSTGSNTGYAGGNVVLIMPLYCVAALLVVGAFIIAVVVVTALLNFTVPPFGTSPAITTVIAYIISFIVIIPAQIGGYFFYMDSADSRLGDVTSYLSFFLIPSIFLLFLAIVTAHHIRRLTYPVV